MKKLFVIFTIFIFMNIVYLNLEAEVRSIFFNYGTASLARGFSVNELSCGNQEKAGYNPNRLSGVQGFYFGEAWYSRKLENRSFLISVENDDLFLKERTASIEFIHLPNQDFKAARKEIKKNIEWLHRLSYNDKISNNNRPDRKILNTSISIMLKDALFIIEKCNERDEEFIKKTEDTFKKLGLYRYKNIFGRENNGKNRN